MASATQRDSVTIDFAIVTALEVAIGIRPKGEFVIGFTFAAEADDEWTKRVGTLLKDLKQFGGSARTYYLHKEWSAHPAIPSISGRAEVHSIVKLPQQRHAATCAALWSDEDERVFSQVPRFLLRDNKIVHIGNLIPPPQENTRLTLLANSEAVVHARISYGHGQTRTIVVARFRIAQDERHLLLQSLGGCR